MSEAGLDALNMLLKEEQWHEFSKKSQERKPPKQKGIYLCVCQRNGIVYIGSAIGEKGLFGRICSQHLNPRYLETRRQKWTKHDDHQASNFIIAQGKPAIDKSSLRKKVGREFGLDPSQTVDHIWDNYGFYWRSLSWMSNDDILCLERALIFKFSPRFNFTIIRK